MLNYLVQDQTFEMAKMIKNVLSILFSHVLQYDNDQISNYTASSSDIYKQKLSAISI